ncbi:hypothetical protein C2S52_012985 [Perilla frutescens var. hirtella]|nr:hypothetical protein C2S52_012985 [Perilla frutescens var. hirtella]
MGRADCRRNLEFLPAAIAKEEERKISNIGFPAAFRFRRPRRDEGNENSIPDLFEVINDRLIGQSCRFGFITMRTGVEAEIAVELFYHYVANVVLDRSTLLFSLDD